MMLERDQKVGMAGRVLWLIWKLSVVWLHMLCDKVLSEDDRKMGKVYFGGQGAEIQVLR